MYRLKASLLVLLVVCKVAYCSWNVSYSVEGTTTVKRYNSPDPDETGTFPWTTTGSGGAGGGATGVVAPGRSITFGSVATSGSVTATATWVAEPGYPLPPELVVVEEIGSAQWTGFTGAASDGLGHALVPNADPNNPGGVSSGSKYTVKQSPGGSFTVTCTLSANCDVPRDNALSVTSGSASCTYAIVVHTPRLVLLGETPTHKVIAGQGAKASVNLDGLPNDTASRFSFTLPTGPRPFADWTYQNPHGNPQMSNGTLTPLPSLTNLTTSMTPQFYFGTGTFPGKEKLKATINLPTISCTLNLDSDNFEVHMGTTVAKPHMLSMQPGKLMLKSNATGTNRFKQQIPNYSEQDPETGEERDIGIFYTASTQNPAEVSEYSGQVALHGWVQLFNDSSSAKVDDPEGTVVLFPPQSEWVLDAWVPYPTNIQPASSPQWAPCLASRNAKLRDSPGFEFSTNAQMNVYKELRFKCHFKSFVMYLPPTNNLFDSKWVPTTMLPWTVDGVALKTTNNGVATWTRYSESSSISAQDLRPVHPTWAKASIPAP